jgi:hypothetical protein
VTRSYDRHDHTNHGAYNKRTDGYQKGGQKSVGEEFPSVLIYKHLENLEAKALQPFGQSQYPFGRFNYPFCKSENTQSCSPPFVSTRFNEKGAEVPPP